MDEEEWWRLFREAAALRAQLRVVESGDEESGEGRLQYQQKAQAISEIKKATFQLLEQSEIPQPLRLLVAQLWGGFQTINDTWPREKMTLLLIEAQEPKGAGNKRLARLLNEREKSSVDPTQVKRWRSDPEYQYLVAQWRRERDIKQGDTATE